jgi:hypothetical protein
MLSQNLLDLLTLISIHKTESMSVLESPTAGGVF